MSDVGTAERPLRVAIVGSGPAGFYAAGQLLDQKDLVVEIEMFDRLATPWGLVRAGVAPDHPKIKAVTRVYEKIAKKAGFHFHGNVDVGTHVTHADLAAHHHAVMYCVGAPTDRRLGIDGEDLPGSHSSTDFVAWYNGHPDQSGFEVDLKGRRAVVVGNGNVALDVARMLVLTHDELKVTDIADHALHALADSNIEEVFVLGRRGPAQAAYTNPELRELGELEDADVIVDPQDMVLDAGSAAWLASDEAGATAKKNVEIAREYSERPPTGKRKRVVLKFLTSPLRIVGDTHVTGVEVVRNELVEGRGGALSARATDRTEIIDCDLVLRSVGYRGTPLPDVPFDEARGTILNDGGRVLDPATEQPLPGVYTAGWVKRGPSGVIGTNKKCAQETVDLLVEDFRAGRLPDHDGSPEALRAVLAAGQPEIVDYAGWERIDAHERELGEAQGRPRVKLTLREELLLRGRRG